VLPFKWCFVIVSPWLLAATLVFGSVAVVSLFDVVRLAATAAVSVFACLGQRYSFGPVQSLYPIFDTQEPLLRVSVELLPGEGDSTWEVDVELQEACE